MSSRQEALFERYRARSLERIRKLSFWLSSLGDGGDAAKALRDVARELHTLKGDSAVVGVERVSEIAHLAEEILLHAKAEDAGSVQIATGVVRAALSAVDANLKAEDPSEKEEQEMLQEIVGMLQGALPGLKDRASAPASLQGEGRATPVPPPEPSKASAPAPAEVKAPVTSSRQLYMSVRSSTVDELCDSVNDFTTDFRALVASLKRLSLDGAALGSLREAAGRQSVNEAADRCLTKLDQLSSHAWALRLVPVAPVLEELAPYVKDLAASQGKRVRVITTGQGAEVERGILEELREPLLHLVRNAADHGVEPAAERGAKSVEAVIELGARQAGAHLVLTVSDDGRGVDVAAVRAAAVERLNMSPEAVAKLTEHEVSNLLFVPGFTTRKSASTTSGRGVGLDVVRGRVDALGGQISVTSTQGSGTRFELSVPSTVGKERAFVVACGEALYALPSVQTLEVVHLKDFPLETSAGEDRLRVRGETIPLRSLSGVLREPSSGSSSRAAIVQGARHRWAFVLPELVGEFELVRRPVDSMVSRFGHIAASATLDDGRLVLILAVNGLVRLAEVGSARAPSAPRGRTRKQILAVDDSATVLDVVSEILADAGYEVVKANNGQEALASIEANQPDLVLSDVEMPIMGGFELLERIRARWPHLPVVMLTTRGGADDRRRALTLGANAYLVKSAFEETLLVDAVRRFFPATP